MANNENSEASETSKSSMLEKGQEDIATIFSNMDQIMSMNKQLAQIILSDAKENTCRALSPDSESADLKNNKLEEAQICWIYCQLGKV